MTTITPRRLNGMGEGEWMKNRQEGSPNPHDYSERVKSFSRRDIGLCQWCQWHVPRHHFEYIVDVWKVTQLSLWRIIWRMWRCHTEKNMSITLGICIWLNWQQSITLKRSLLPPFTTLLMRTPLNTLTTINLLLLCYLYLLSIASFPSGKPKKSKVVLHFSSISFVWVGMTAFDTTWVSRLTKDNGKCKENPRCWSVCTQNGKHNRAPGVDIMHRSIQHPKCKHHHLRRKKREILTASS